MKMDHGISSRVSSALTSWDSMNDKSTRIIFHNQEEMNSQGENRSNPTVNVLMRVERTEFKFTEVK